VSQPPTTTETPPPTNEPPKAPEAAKPPEAPKEAPKPSGTPASAPLALTDLKAPEGLEIDQALGNEFVILLNDQNLSRSDLANKLIELQSKALTTASEKSSQEFVQLQEQWRNEVMADSEIGGSKWNGTQSSIAKLLDAYGDEKTRLAFDVTGAGNNPDVVRFLAKVGNALAAGLPRPGSPGSQERTHADILFPNQTR
jgi:hypothetical protein